MGYTQAPHVMELFASAGLTDITVRQDLAGHDRFVSGVKP
jgi:methylase of polypeptide subunit release factors